MEDWYYATFLNIRVYFNRATNESIAYSLIGNIVVDFLLAFDQFLWWAFSLSIVSNEYGEIAITLYGNVDHKAYAHIKKIMGTEC